MSEKFSSTISSDEEIAAEEMAHSLADDLEKTRKFGSYCIIHEHFNKNECEDFINSNLAETIGPYLEKLNITKILTLMERHPEILDIFLTFFANIKPKQHPGITYIQHLINIIPRCPIKWIASFALDLENARLSTAFVNSTVSSYINAKPHILDQIRLNKETMKKILKNSTTTRGNDYTTSWQSLMKYREQCRELIEFKFDLTLNDYTNLDKSEFVIKMISQCDRPNKLVRCLRTQIIPYCELNSITIEPIIYQGIAKKTWDIKSKLSIITEFMKSTTTKQKALQILQFSGESEYKQIEEYAQQNNIDYNPDPDIFSKCISSYMPVQRSESLANFSVSSLPEKNTVTRKASQPIGYKRSPSIDLSLSSLGSLSHFSSIADGNPKDPEEYALKLKKFRNLKQIRPIYDLASTYGIVISYDGYSKLFSRQEIFYKLISRNGWDDMVTISQVLALNTNELMDIISQNHNYAQNGQVILPKILQYITRWNSNVFYQFTESCMFECLPFTPLKEIIELWHDCLQNVFTLIKYDSLDTVLIYARLLEVFKNFPDNKNLQNDIFDIMKTKKDLIEINESLIEKGLTDASRIFIPDIENYDFDVFKEDFCSGDIDRVSRASTQLRKLSFENAKDYLENVILTLDGCQYSLLAYCYSMLEELGQDRKRELNILVSLYDGPKHSVNFHELMENPLQTLQNHVNNDTLNGLLNVANFCDVGSDELIVYVIVNKMSSPFIDDYRDLIFSLKDRTHKELLTVLAPRLNKEDLSLFYQLIGLVKEQLMTQIAMDLNKNGLSAFAEQDLLINPVKLIRSLYNKIELHETHGRRLHKIVEKIASSYKIDLRSLKWNLLMEYLNEDYPELKEDEFKIYGTTNDEILTNADNEVVSKCLFLLRTQNPGEGLKFLKQKIEFKLKSKSDMRSQIKSAINSQEKINTNSQMMSGTNSQDKISTNSQEKINTNSQEKINTKSQGISSTNSQENLVNSQEKINTRYQGMSSTNSHEKICIYSHENNVEKGEHDEITPRMIARSILCMFGIGDEETIMRYVTNDMKNLDDLYTKSLFCAHASYFAKKEFDLDLFNPENIDQVLEDYLDEGWALLIRIYLYIQNDEKIIEILPKLAEKRKLEVLHLVPLIANRQIIRNPIVFNSILKVIGSSVEDLINKELHTKPFKSRQQTIFQTVLNVVSLLPPFDSLIINGEKLLIPNIIVLLTKIGHSNVAGELGSRMSNLKTRLMAMKSLIDAGHFDTALSVGFDMGKVFEYITKHKVSEATQIMIDENFVKYTSWLYLNHKTDAITKVEQALTKQGRTREIQRMKKRFEDLESKKSQERIHIE
ncbi:hypothetical protein TVAG_145290 [Trichomonas vaginalis G3]|uniref:Uncharacterized protein n=1 Tax=Trichomonas vaginalis (strain ATCC PRA-98 / G3) TaxID=412133 RepID=A2EUL1_TRIV3|nr:kinetochore-associated protein 1 family [Trichomonas vaginalis G3]EAY03660.1 hypothetical protein TVAG_145290 [Trichomonas vaginalis G3]KAI5520286.1 kinetochore-associated protein 1 family [Trichomonas vaginalis G3]|eukprot:XP_001315883.1 hypothetical protein [Trichomonas vaginalis G3]